MVPQASPRSPGRKSWATPLSAGPPLPAAACPSARATPTAASYALPVAMNLRPPGMRGSPTAGSCQPPDGACWAGSEASRRGSCVLPGCLSTGPATAAGRASTFSGLDSSAGSQQPGASAACGAATDSCSVAGRARGRWAPPVLVLRSSRAAAAGSKARPWVSSNRMAWSCTGF